MLTLPLRLLLIRSSLLRLLLDCLRYLVVKPLVNDILTADAVKFVIVPLNYKGTFDS